VTSNWLLERRKTHVALLGTNPIPRRYLEAELEQVPHETLKTVARKYARNFWDVAPLGIAPLLVGATSEYKTVTAAVIARAVREVGLLDVGWCNCAADFTTFDRDTFSVSTQQALAALKNVPFLVMDDFTQVTPGTRMMATMIEVGSYRFDNLLPTLWTGNLTLDRRNLGELSKLVGTALSRRILETSEGYKAIVARA
jgi:hypothetical protein